MKTRAIPKFWNLPNLVTLSRLVMALVLFWLISAAFYLTAFAVFVVAALTDALDGYLARRMGLVTFWGRQLDPLVDKILVSGGFIFLLAIPDTGLAPWMVTVIVVRELLIQAMRSHFEGHGVAFGAALSGKLKTTFQFLAIAAILLCLHQPSSPLLYLIRDVFIWTAVGLTLYSGFAYVYGAWVSDRKRAQPEENRRIAEHEHEREHEREREREHQDMSVTAS